MYVQLHMWARGARARARALDFLSRLAALRCPRLDSQHLLRSPLFINSP
jgi:hypothetical protein